MTGSTRLRLHLAPAMVRRVQRRADASGSEFVDELVDLLVAGLPDELAELAATGLAASTSRARPIDIVPAPPDAKLPPTGGGSSDILTDATVAAIISHCGLPEGSQGNGVD